MEESQQICLMCFHLIPANEQVCPQCGADLAAYSAQSYRVKLKLALLHPLADVRMRAIIALGWRAESETAGDLVACALRHPSDLVEGLEIINSLVQLGDADVRRIALSDLQARHPAHAVREGAAMALASLPNRGENNA